MDEEKRVVIWDLKNYELLTSLEINGTGNTILIDPTSNDEFLIFYVLGIAGFFFKYEYNVAEKTIKTNNCLK